MATPYHSFGTTFTWNSQLVAGLTAINGIELTVTTLDVTTHQSANFYKEILPGIIDAGDVVLEGEFDPADTNGQQGLMTDLNARVSRTAIITFPASTGTTWTFTGYVTKLKIGDAPLDGKIPFTCTVSPTGKPTFAIATSTGLTTPFFTMSTGTIIPAVSGSILSYVVEVVTGTTGVTITPTAAAGVITVTANGASQVVGSGNASSSITLGAATTITVITVSVQETNKAPKVYTVNVARA